MKVLFIKIHGQEKERKGERKVERENESVLVLELKHELNEGVIVDPLTRR